MEAVMPKTRAATAKLSDRQLLILSAAAQQPDGSLLPFPQGLSVRGAALGKLVETLCKRRLVEERPSVPGAPEWRRDDTDRRPLGLFITKSGLLALGIDESEETKPAQAAASMLRQRRTAAAKPQSKARKASADKGRAEPARSKRDVVIQMLRRRSGVTIEEIIAETCWQPHSVRGFFSGLVKKKLKLPLTSEVGKDGARRYRIAPLASAKA
jgi:hypothetical protein